MMFFYVITAGITGFLWMLAGQPTAAGVMGGVVYIILAMIELKEK